MSKISGRSEEPGTEEPDENMAPEADPLALAAESPAEPEPQRAGRALKLAVVAALALPVLAASVIFVVGEFSADDAGTGVAGVNSVFSEQSVNSQVGHDFSLTTLDGDNLSLSDLRGKWVLLDFWAPYCPPCREEAPELARAYEKWQFNNVEFVAVATLPLGDQEQMVREFVEREGVPFPVALDSPNSELALSFGVVALPEKFIIMPDGQLHTTKILGPVTAERLDELFSTLQSEAGS